MEKSKMKNKSTESKVLRLLMLLTICISLAYQVEGADYTPAKLSTMISELDDVVKELSDAGFGTNRVEDIIQEANTAHLNQEFDSIPALIEQVHQLRDKAFSVNEDITKLENSINLAKDDLIDVNEVEEVLVELNLEMKLENYEQCEILIDEANNLMSGLVSGQYLSQIDRISTLNNLASDIGLDLSRIDDISNELEGYIAKGDLENIILLVNELDMIENSINSVVSVNNIISESAKSEISTLRFEDILDEVKYHFKRKDFEEVLKLGSEAESLYELAKGSKQLINYISSEIVSLENKDIDFSKVERFFEEGKREYELENYISSKEMLDQSLLELEQAKSDALLFGVINTDYTKVRFIAFMKNYWWALLIVITIFVFAGKEGYSRIQKEFLERRITKLEQELVFIDKAIKKKQEEYFSKKIISKSEYNTTVDEHQERMLVIREKLPVLKGKLNKRENMHKR